MWYYYTKWHNTCSDTLLRPWPFCWPRRYFFAQIRCTSAWPFSRKGPRLHDFEPSPHRPVQHSPASLRCHWPPKVVQLTMHEKIGRGVLDGPNAWGLKSCVLGPSPLWIFFLSRIVPPKCIIGVKRPQKRPNVLGPEGQATFLAFSVLRRSNFLLALRAISLLVMFVRLDVLLSK
jgi:hypothetical protein